MLDKLRELLSSRFSPDELDQKLKVVESDLQVPARIIGIGQTGVGKTELLKSIFRISEDDLAQYRNFKAERDEDFYRLKTGSTRSVTKDFFSFTIRSSEGFRIEFTDGPGLGECAGTKEEEYLQRWTAEIPKHDLLYWVLDGSSRDIAHIQQNMHCILDGTGYRNKLVVVLNKVDQILLPREMEEKGIMGWDHEFGGPSKALEDLIRQRVDDATAKLETYVQIDPNQVVACSARQRWNHGQVLDKILEFLPQEVKIKASRNREVKDFTELLSDRARRAIATGEMPKIKPHEHRSIGITNIPDMADRLCRIKSTASGTLRLAGIGQTGVGKTELLRSLFGLKNDDLGAYLRFRSNRDCYLSLLKTGSVRSVTKDFHTFPMEGENGLSLMFTDGPGLGESSGNLEDRYIKDWIKTINQCDLLYWVLDGSSRDIAHIQLNMKTILDMTGYHDKIVVILNKVDQILLPLEEEIGGVVGWDIETNQPSRRLLELIQERTEDVIQKLSCFVKVRRDRIAICSARRRWNLPDVLDCILRAM